MKMGWRCLVVAFALAVYVASLMTPTIEIVVGAKESGHEAFSGAYQYFTAFALREWDWWLVGGSWFANPAL